MGAKELQIKDYSEIIRQTCQQLSQGQVAAATKLITAGYPFALSEKSKRQYTTRQMTKVFVRDGFIDRYKGTKLIYPPALKLISHYLPKEFPYHKNGKMTEGHMAYWELFPTIDHKHSVSKAGKDSEENWRTCSMLTNAIKSHWTLEHLGWEELPVGDIALWDGMLR